MLLIYIRTGKFVFRWICNSCASLYILTGCMNLIYTYTYIYCINGLSPIGIIQIGGAEYNTREV